MTDLQAALAQARMALERGERAQARAALVTAVSAMSPAGNCRSRC